MIVAVTKVNAYSSYSNIYVNTDQIVFMEPEDDGWTIYFSGSQVIKVTEDSARMLIASHNRISKEPGRRKIAKPPAPRPGRR